MYVAPEQVAITPIDLIRERGLAVDVESFLAGIECGDRRRTPVIAVEAFADDAEVLRRAPVRENGPWVEGALVGGVRLASGHELCPACEYRTRREPLDTNAIVFGPTSVRCVVFRVPSRC